MVSPTLVELAPGRVSRNLRRSPRRLGPYWMPELQSYSFHGVYRRKDRFRQFVQQAPSLACKSGAQRVHARPWISVPIILFCRAREAGGHVQLTSGLYEALPRVLNEVQREACYRFPGGSAMAMESAKHCCPEPGEQCLAQGSSRRSRAMHTHPIKGGRSRPCPRYSFNHLLSGWLVSDASSQG